ncbi:hypothetical protein [Leptolyngbya ohadii]|uniref:hypothetical protein n=1 Tax=Leptolyngbya ohadii TaxID=1962290 RepID=UPI00117BA7C6|nr:hypothetical protein [Leptolyngbya ohadii]
MTLLLCFCRADRTAPSSSVISINSSDMTLELFYDRPDRSTSSRLEVEIRRAVVQAVGNDFDRKEPYPLKPHSENFVLGGFLKIS